MDSKCYLLITPITLLLLIATVGVIAVYGYATIDKGREERPPTRKRDGGASATRSSSPWPSPSPAAPELAPRPRDPAPGPAATAAALLFLLPALGLVHHPALYLPASILVLLTPARNSASLPAPPPVSPRWRQQRQRPAQRAASTPQWTRRQRTTGRGPPSPRRRHPYRPQRGGGRGAEHSALALPGSHSRSVRCQVPPHDHPSSSSSSAGDWRG
jgi:hypothetical protein